MAALRGLMQVRAMSSTAEMIRPPIQVFGTEGKYATALYSAAAKSKKLDDVEKELVKFQSMLMSDKKSRDYLLDPTVKRTIKQSALLDLAKKENMNQVTANFLGLVAGNGRLNMINQIVNAFKLMMAAERGEIICEVITAKALEGNQQKELESALNAFMKPGQKLLLRTKVDPAIIGGMVVSIGDRYADMSLASKIKKYAAILQTAA